MSDKHPVTLEYGRTHRRWLPRWLNITIASIVILSIVALVLYRHYQPYITQAMSVWHQHQLMTWTWPADKIIYTEDPTLAAKLLQSGRYQRKEFGTSNLGPDPVPSDWPRGVCLFDGEQLHFGPLQMTLEPLFRHERRSKAGHERLVDLGVSEFAKGQHERVVTITQRAITPATLTPGSRPSSRSYGGAAIELLPTDRITLFAGQADPKDLSHMTVPYELNGQRGIIDGWLQDRDSIKMKVRTGPARLASPRWWTTTPAPPTAAEISSFYHGHTP